MNIELKNKQEQLAGAIDADDGNAGDGSQVSAPSPKKIAIDINKSDSTNPIDELERQFKELQLQEENQAANSGAGPKQGEDNANANEK